MFFVRLSIAWLFSMNNKTNLSEFAGVFFIKFLCKQLDFIKITLRSLVLIQYFECVLFTDCCFCSFWCRGGSFFLPFFLFSVKCTLVSCLSHVCVCLHVMRVYLLASVYVLLECVTLMHKVSRSACYFVVPNIILFVWFSFFFFYFLIALGFTYLSRFPLSSYSFSDYGGWWDFCRAFFFLLLLLLPFCVYRLACMGMATKKREKRTETMFSEL